MELTIRLGRHYAHLVDGADGVRVAIMRRTNSWSGPTGPALGRVLHVETIDAPLHLVADQLHDVVLPALERGDRR